MKVKRSVLALMLATSNIQAQSSSDSSEPAQCMLSYQEYKDADGCLVDIKRSADRAYLPPLMQGTFNLKDGTCMQSGSDSIKITCEGTANKRATIKKYLGNTQCSESVTPVSTSLQIDGQCQNMQVDGQVVAGYKATPIPPEPRCMAKLQVFATEEDCTNNKAVAESANESNSIYKFVFNQKYTQNTCVDASITDQDISVKIECDDGTDYNPDKKAKLSVFTGSKDCAALADSSEIKTVDLLIDDTCKEGTNPVDSSSFWYKASPAQCFLWYGEYESEQDCSNNKIIASESSTPALYPFLIESSSQFDSKFKYDKGCHAGTTSSHRITCNTIDNYSKEEGVPDSLFNIEQYKSTDCSSGTNNANFDKVVQQIKVTNKCQTFSYIDSNNQEKNRYYKAVKTTATDIPGPDPRKKEDDEPKCTDNKIEGDTANPNNNGKRCIYWNEKVAMCSSMGQSGDFLNGLYKQKSRLETQKAPKSNLCKTTCIDRGDVFCVNKNDLSSDPVCCPKECGDEENGVKNQCSNTLVTLGNHICTDQFSQARDEFKYLVCPPEEMESSCGVDKIIEFDLDKDNQITKKFQVKWIKPFQNLFAGNLDPVFNFEKQAVCSYVIKMPQNAGSGSSIKVTFFGDNRDLNINTQAYYAIYRSPSDLSPETSMGEILTKYDGKWNRKYPVDQPTQEMLKNQNLYIQEIDQATRSSDGEKKKFDEQNQLIDLIGDSDGAKTQFYLTRNDNDPDKNMTVAYISITSSHKASTQDGSRLMREYVRNGGAFYFEVTTNFRKPGDPAIDDTEEAIKTYEKKEEEDKELAFTIILLALAGVLVLVILIFIYQAICSRHTQNEVQKRSNNYKKEDAIIRHTLKVRKSTMAANVGRMKKGSVASEYKNVPQNEAEKGPSEAVDEENNQQPVIQKNDEDKAE